MLTPERLAMIEAKYFAGYQLECTEVHFLLYYIRHQGEMLEFGEQLLKESWEDNETFQQGYWEGQVNMKRQVINKSYVVNTSSVDTVRTLSVSISDLVVSTFDASLPENNSR